MRLVLGEKFEQEVRQQILNTPLAGEQQVELREYVESLTAVQATGCRGAGSYREAFRKMGYPYLEVLEQCSSAGDWTFIVSCDKENWYIAWQTNNWPRAGFSYSVDQDTLIEGTAEEAMTAFCEMYS